jgi:2,3-bisphosphoglycerate-dependent phosphoglycerate mutase
MESTVYLIRHCKAAGQEPDAPLTAAGFEQARGLADGLAPLGIDRIVSSPFLRARQSIEPLAAKLGIAVETDDRLVERVLSGPSLADWQVHLERSFADLDLALPGGESSRAAMIRAVAALDAAALDGHPCIALVTHGNLMALLLKHVDPRVGFPEWKQLANPDVYTLRPGQRAVFARLRLA